jgi:hypothetical protein
MSIFHRSGLALLVLIPLSSGATDYEVTYDGGSSPSPIVGFLNDDIFLGAVDPLFHRPVLNDVPCSESGLNSNDFRYETIAVTNTSSESVDVEIKIDTELCDDDHDSAVFAYSPSFDPADPSANCVASNDDHNDYCSLISTTVAPAQTTFFVVTSAHADETWQWTARFNDHVFRDDLECFFDDDFNCSGAP